MVAVHGRLQIRQYETQEGQRREAAEVVANQVVFLRPAEPRADDGTSDEVPC